MNALIVLLLFIGFNVFIWTFAAHSNIPFTPDKDKDLYIPPEPYKPRKKELTPQQRHYQEMKALSDRQYENTRKWEQELAEDWLDEHDEF